MDAWYFDEEGTEYRLEHAEISPVYFASIRRFLARHRVTEFIRLSPPKKADSPPGLLDCDLTCDFFEIMWKNGPRLTSDGVGPIGSKLEQMLRTTAVEGLLSGETQGDNRRKERQ